MGAGGPKDWVTITDNPSGKEVYNGFFLAKKGAKYGYENSRTVPMLVRLPASVDSSSGGQCWSHAEKWGPLSGTVIHTSYSRCAAFYCFIQDIEPYPNGFAVRFPFDLDSGAMRPRLHPIDNQVYITCHKGWDTNAPLDGVIYRVRHAEEDMVGVCDAAVTGSGIRLTFAADLDPASVKSSAFRAFREDDSKKGPKPPAYELGKARLINPRTVEINVPGIEKESLANRTDEKGNVKVGDEFIINQQTGDVSGDAFKKSVSSDCKSLCEHALGASEGAG